MSEPPCGLPAELWTREILRKDPLYLCDHGQLMWLRTYDAGVFLYGRALRLTCRWFARTITNLYLSTTHEGFWPAVEAYVKNGYGAALMALDWPTHPRCSLSLGYGSANHSYGRAGLEVVERNDIPLMRVLLLQGREWWPMWMARAIHHNHLDMLQVLVDATDWPGLVRRDEWCLWGFRCSLVDSKYNPYDSFAYYSAPSKRTPLHVTMQYNNFEAFKMLYKAKHVRQYEPAAAVLQAEAKKGSLIWWFLAARR